MRKLLLTLNFLPLSVAFAQCLSTGNGSEGVFHATTNTTIPSGVHNYSTFIIDPGVTVTASGNLPLEIYVTGTATINGILTVSGANGANGVTYSNGGNGAIGVAGGGNGGNGSYSSSSGPLDGTDGTGTGGLNNKGAGWSGGGGAGYATAGQATGGGTGGFAGIAYGDAQITGMTAGSGGGGGSGGYECGAGGGGAGGGILLLQANSIVISSTGSITSNGGNGGTDGTGNCGGGGAGSGGSLIIGALNTFNNDGIISAAGGIGGASMVPGSPYFGIGGNGAQGRIKLSNNMIGSGSVTPTAGGQVSSPGNMTELSVTGTCDGSNNGAASILVTGGTAPYTYNWTESSEISPNPNLLIQGMNHVTITDAVGCSFIDSVFIPTFPIYSMNQTLTICSGESVVVGNSTYNATGNYTDVLTTVNGCDSIITTDLTVNLSFASTQNISLCDGESVTVGGNTYNTSGTYTDILTAVNGCDSTVTTNLTIENAINTSVSLNIATLTSAQAGANYQWIDCSTQSPISNATLQSFTPVVTGNYAVIVTVNNCTETSACTIVDFTTINELEKIATIYPNPTNGLVTVSFQSETEIATITLTDNTGRILKSEGKQTVSSYSFDLSNEAKGIYFLSIEMGGQIQTTKITKQ